MEKGDRMNIYHNVVIAYPPRMVITRSKHRFFPNCSACAWERGGTCWKNKERPFALPNGGDSLACGKAELFYAPVVEFFNMGDAHE